ncbi:ABC transporter ATP-binding protein [Lishizhenia sp.]|uniref:ABC transporter ATP-binding protein n=1 Tax=Lishizhenia sp. TaxID=2497594 RepID=UPI00299EE9F3|nr:ABC transporter ATP-binding protein [Lishizhenia sp.]MDX1446224.1 ABC transporter ATP-binding protein [Lishizhenia sp.]
MLKAQGIIKSYGNLEVLKGIDLNISKSEVVSIVGSSGAGKTTLLQILGTLEKPDQGSLEIGGVNPFKLTQKSLAKFRNEQLGFIFQFHQLLPEFTALENAIMPALIKGTNKAEAEKIAKEIFKFLNIENRNDNKPDALSGGEQQRIAVARALINQPKVIFADEPSGNLDSKNSEELHKLFFQLRDEFGQTFVIVTHNENLANMADRKLVMSDGLIVNSEPVTATESE